MILTVIEGPVDCPSKWISKLEKENERFKREVMSHAFTLNDYQQLSKRMIPEFGKEAILNYALGLTGETGEIVDILKKYVFHHTIDRNKVLLELGDVFHYLAGLSTLLGFSLSEVATANIDKLNQQYPDGYEKEV